ncbi:MAG TPA: hypothetical protein VF070_18655 [Streptosporangiaceae bacterium]
MPVSRRKPVDWPAAGSGTAAFAAVPAGKSPRMPAGPTAGSARAGSLPVWIGQPSIASASPASPVAVSMSPHTAATRLGIRGVVLSVARADGSAAAGRVHVSVDYGSFADAYSGSYASRLHMVELPACALTTPQVAACRKQAAVVSADDVRASWIGSDVTLASGPLVLAVTASSYGPGGNFGAEPLSEENQWVTSGSSGTYAYSYPITLPPVPGGLQPSVSLDYSSQKVDGLNASTNNQASWIGDGWTYEPGFIENDYPTCAAAQQLIPPTLDLCSASPEQTMTLNGTTTPLVVSSDGTTHPEADGGQQVIQTPATGQDPSGGYEVIQPDGTQYWFGVNQLPGWTSGDPVTNSIWTVPVSSSGKFQTGTWRYMLDYVVDPHGDAIAYFYNTQTNYSPRTTARPAPASTPRAGCWPRSSTGCGPGTSTPRPPRPRSRLPPPPPARTPLTTWPAHQGRRAR